MLFTCGSFEGLMTYFASMYTGLTLCLVKLVWVWDYIKERVLGHSSLLWLNTNSWFNQKFCEYTSEVCISRILFCVGSSVESQTVKKPFCWNLFVEALEIVIVDLKLIWNKMVHCGENSFSGGNLCPGTRRIGIAKSTCAFLPLANCNDWFTLVRFIWFRYLIFSASECHRRDFYAIMRTRCATVLTRLLSRTNGLLCSPILGFPNPLLLSESSHLALRRSLLSLHVHYVL